MAEKKKEEVVHKNVKRLTKEIKMNGGVWIKDKILGQGGCATVHLAKSVLQSKTHLDIDDSIETPQPPPPLIAVKSVPLWGPGHDDLSEECEIFLELKPSPYIIQFLGEYYTEEKKDEPSFDLCFEYALGGSLHDRIRSSSNEGLDEMEVRCYTRSILKGLKHIHDQGLVHCDLKPQNILICENNVAKIADFGLAVKRDRLPKIRNYLFRGTYLYVAPEEINSQSYEPISDIWGLGCIVLEMLSGRQPWGFDPNTDLDSIVTYIAESEDLPMIPPNISMLAKDFLSNCFVRDTKLRWTADMLLEHPFITLIEQDIYINYFAKKLREKMEIEKKKKKRKRDQPEDQETEELNKVKRCNYGLADMLLEHPFITLIEQDIYINYFAKKLREKMEIEKKKKKRKRDQPEDQETEELNKVKRCNYGLRRCAEMIDRRSQSEINGCW